MAISRQGAQLRQLIQGFLDERLKVKLDKIKPDKNGAFAQKDEDLRQKHIDEHKHETWLADAASRAHQIAVATHTIKHIHPNARGTSLYVLPQQPSAVGLVSSHCLQGKATCDATGNAGALDVYGFLCLEHDDRTLLQRLHDNEPDALAALSNDKKQATQWRNAFVAISQNSSQPASHTLAKQVYFPLKDGAYHLLAPLFPSGLTHTFYQRVREDRFGEAAKAARQAHHEQKSHAHGYCEYQNLAIQQVGGSNPQGVSLLASKHRGENYLLASLPPHWQSPTLRLPLKSDSVFNFLYRHNRPLRNRVQELRHFLATTAHNNLAIRNYRKRRVADICDEFHQYAATLRDEATPGWSAKSDCKLHEAEQIWLDPLRVHQDEDFKARRLWRDWPQQASERFGNWLNRVLESEKLKMDAASAAQWEADLHDELNLFKELLDDRS
ncbi:type I-F CRISPR-associated protein Csy1 [Betaproteobacteria bacterium]|nr:type I-F CRISPR-associated protein Csy1 [Betaproteobacteria bacterium]GHU44691.1 type I-F CRISPR-associated protein Csy1 [Betaproteobacteria bacterium]